MNKNMMALHTKGGASASLKECTGDNPKEKSSLLPDSDPLHHSELSNKTSNGLDQ